MWLFNARKSAKQAPRTPSSGPGTPSTDPVDEYKLLLRQRTVLLRGTLTDEVGTDLIARLLFLQYENRQEPIQLWIDSPGGVFTTGLAIIDTIRALEPPVHTSCAKQAHGLAAVILACGESGHRVIMQGAELSLLPVTTEGSQLDPVHRDKATHRLASILAGHCDQDIETVLQDLEEGTYFNPQGAVEYGLADRIVELTSLVPGPARPG
ncbi:MAG: ATP-dependent Clp protease proteolytic subunit [Gemmatales bacterium]